MNVGTIFLSLKVDKNGFKQDMKSVEGSAKQAGDNIGRQLGGIGSAIKRIGGMMAAAFAVKKLVDFGAKCIELGSDLAEVQNVVDVTFPAMKNQVDEFAKGAAASFGLSETMAKKYTGAFGAMAKSFGFTEKEAYGMSTTLTGLSGDLASFYNISQDEAYTKLKSVFTGETESLKDLGVVMTQTALDSYAMANGFGQTTAQMSEAEKVALRFAFVTDQLSLAGGDFARTSDSWANQVRILKLQFESFMASVGQGLINLFTPVIKVINFLLSKLMTAGNAFKAFTELITGKKATEGSGVASVAEDAAEIAGGMNDAAGGANNLGKATDGAGKAAKKAAKEMKSMFGFDQITKLSDNGSDAGDGGSGGSGGGGGGGKGGGGGSTASKAIKGASVDMGKMAEGGENKLKGLFDYLGKLRDAFGKGFTTTFRADGLDKMWNNLKSIGSSIKSIFDDKGVQNAAAKFGVTLSSALGKVTGAVGNVLLGLGVFISGSLAQALNENLPDIKSWITTMFSVVGKKVAAIGSVAKDISQIFYDAVTSGPAKKIGSDIITTIGTAIGGKLMLVQKWGADTMAGIAYGINQNKTGITKALTGVLSAIAPITDTIKTAVKDIFGGLNKVYDEKIKPLIDSIWLGVSGFITLLVNGFNTSVLPVLQSFGDKFKTVYNDHIKPAIDAIIALIGKIADMLKTLWETIFVPLMDWFMANIMPVLAPIIQALGDVFLAVFGTIGDVVSGLATALGGLVDFITGVFSGNWELAWNGIKAVFSGIWDAIVGVVSGAWEAIKAVFAPVGEFFKAVWNSISSAFSTAATWFKTMFDSAWTAVKNAFAPVTEFFGGVWTAVKTAFSAVTTWFTTTFNAAWTGIKNAFSSVATFFSGVWEGIKAAFSTVTTWFSTTFTAAWTAVKNVFSAAGEIFVAIKDGIVSVLKGVINGLISGINTVIAIPFNAINGALNLVRGIEILGWYPFEGLPTIGVPQIPLLAQGGFVKANTPQLAMIGDNKHYGEIVAPENKMLDMARKAAELAGNGSSAELLSLLRSILQAILSLDLTIDGDSLTHKIVAKINEIAVKTGESPIMV